MATSSGLYSNRVKDLMGDNSSTGDRAQAYKESVEIKSTKNHIERMEERTAIFQAHLLKSTLNQEESLKKIEKHTKIMSGETFLGQILKIVGFATTAYRVIKVLRPNLIPDILKRVDHAINYNSKYGAKGMMQCCCCDDFGRRGRMGGRGGSRRGRTGGRTGGVGRSGDVSRERAREARKRAQERATRARTTQADRVSRTRQVAQELKDRKIRQIQSKQVQDNIKKSMTKWSHTAQTTIKGIFDGSGRHLKGAATTIGMTSAVAAKNLTRVGVGAVGTIAGAIGGLLGAAGAIKMGGGIAAGSAAAASLYLLNKQLNLDHNKNLNYLDDIGAGQRDVSILGNIANIIGLGQPNRLLRKQAREFEALGMTGSPESLSQLFADLDELAGKPFGFKKGFFGQIGNSISFGLEGGYNSLKRIFSPITGELENQTEILAKTLDSNFKEIHKDNKELRREYRENQEKIQWDDGTFKPQGIPTSQGHGGVTSPAIPRHGGNVDLLPSDIMAGASTGETKASHHMMLSPETVWSTKPGASREARGWSTKPVPDGFTGSAGAYNTLMSTRRISAANPKSSMETDSRGYVISTADTSMMPHQRAFLDTLAIGDASAGGNYWESDRYNRIVGGGSFTDFSQHPNIVGYRGKHGSSTAAGRYQFLNSTWKDVVRRYNAANPDNPITDFSPANQDRAAYFLAQQDYKRRTGRDLDSDLQQGNTQYIREGLGGSGKNTTWEILQKKSSSTIDAAFKSNLKRNEGYEQNSASSGVTALLDPQQIPLTTSLPEIPGAGSAGAIGLAMANEGKVRDKPITSTLAGHLREGVAKIFGEGYSVEVYSGGQWGEQRTGSHRHDFGNAADIRIKGPDGNIVTGDALAPLGQYWLANKIGGVGLEMNQDSMGRGGIHLDTHWNDAKDKNNFWSYGNMTEGQRLALEAGRKGIMPQLLPETPGVKPVPVEITSISPRTHQDAVNLYSQEKGLGSIFGLRRAHASTPGYADDGVRTTAKGSRLPAQDFVHDRIEQAHKATAAHVEAERIRPNISPPSSIAAASESISIPSSIDYASQVPTVNTPTGNNPIGPESAPDINTIPHYPDPELMYPLLHHHLGG